MRKTSRPDGNLDLAKNRTMCLKSSQELLLFLSNVSDDL